MDHQSTLISRLLRVEDAPVIARLYRANREFLAPWEPAREESFFTAEAQRKIAVRLLDQHAQGRNLPHVILDQNGGIVGRITINDIVRGAAQSGRVGYWVSQHANGRGYASRAIAEMKRIAFGELDLHRLEAGTLVHNVRSQRALARNGFERFGLAPRSIRIAGRWQDHVLFQVLNE